MTVPGKLNRDQMAWRVARDIPGGAVVNLGIGMPEMVANHVDPGREVIFHCENGILSMGPVAAQGEEDFDLITAGKKPVTWPTGRPVSPASSPPSAAQLIWRKGRDRYSS